MPHYRVHILDSRGDLLGAIDVDCTDDEAAKDRTAELLGDHGGELWRRVALFQPNNQSVQQSDQKPAQHPRIRNRKSH
jgi:hypothetical protein